MVLTKMNVPRIPPPLDVRDAGTPPTLQMKETIEAYLGQKRQQGQAQAQEDSVRHRSGQNQDRPAL